MDASHILVGGLAAVTTALLVWIEIRSRRNTVAQESSPAPLVQEEQIRPRAAKKRWER
jgi:hypothetical protein